MYLAPDEDESRIADEASKILADITPISRLHENGSVALTGAARRAIAELGWFGLSLAEDAGGAGMSEIEFALFFREAGRQCAPIELLSQNLAVLLSRDQPEIRDLLLNGERGVALLVTSGAVTDGVVGDAGDLRLLGDHHNWALEIKPESARLLDISKLTSESLASLDPAISMRRLSDTAPVTLLHIADNRLWKLGQLAVAAMLVGIAEAALKQVVDYAKIRETFGKLIGSYQAVRHPCADMATRLEAARCQLWFAATAMKESRNDAFGHLDAAKHLANECAAFVTDLNIQLHGGIGVTDEHDAHIFMKHALLLRKLFGSKRMLLKNLLHANFGV